ncbi:helix-turn-helix transcriptional regulator [Mesorhizobium sp. BAC0120]|uniref:AraC family transcriptional regulator n=1 Tax=Mesorhizobium sp. BAC0120 TaxID=3090670 RepID=UPI00298CD325|nr:helix-turn-helix transcriptional regulator [Mesorhizobium sp. BAC0120]MDW6021612.1 helix-turn-helix transcriptional regulator [Mesorhizobium sp. BAC0120]
MTVTPVPMQRLSTEDIPQRERLSFVHDFVGHYIGGLRFRHLDSEDVRIDLAAMWLPGELTVGQTWFSPVHGARARDLLQDGREHYLLATHNEDHELSVDGKDPVRVAAGDLTLVNEAVCSEFWFGKPQAVYVMALDRRLLARLAPRVDMEASYILPATAPHMRLLTGYADSLRSSPPTTEKASEMASRHIYDLTALVLDGFVRGGAERNEISIAEARLKLVQKDILERLSDQSLHIDAVARRQGVTPRYIQRLFESSGTTFSDFVREHRLELAFRLLRERDPGSSTITAIAHDAGFSELSSFNRAFRKRFEATPSEIRAATLLK